MKALDVLEKIKAAGIVGAGGAGFPTHVKLDSAPEYLIVNGAECEPLLRVDQQLGAMYAAELLETLETLRSARKASRAIYGLKEKYHDAVDALSSRIGKYPNIEIKTLRNTYPAGDEQVLVYETTGRVVPEGGIPIAVGAVVLNVETLYNIWRAFGDVPVTEKFVTVGGAVKFPSTVKFPIGIAVREALDYCGGPTVEDFAIIDGGPMMGKLTVPEAPVTKTTKGLLVLPGDHGWVVAKGRGMERMMKMAKISCCHCMLCTDICPRNLLGHKIRPDKMMRLASYNTTAEKDAAATESFLCCECSLCELGCVMGLQPWKLHRELKRRLGELGVKNPHRESPKSAREFREFRLYPVQKLIRRTGVSIYDVPAPMRGVYDKAVQSVTLPLRQSLGAPSKPCVEEGDRVERGGLVAEIPEGALGSRLHSPVSGRVLRLDDKSMTIVTEPE
ncbi:MAG: SLBB domain-containing protein [Synergistaceae bacterium]|nr:SLBB domain-containing protein [Synergistaceae bacterium]